MLLLGTAVLAERLILMVKERLILTRKRHCIRRMFLILALL
jgi:hypothetical protein